MSKGWIITTGMPQGWALVWTGTSWNVGIKPAKLFVDKAEADGVAVGLVLKGHIGQISVVEAS